MSCSAIRMECENLAHESGRNLDLSSFITRQAIGHPFPNRANGWNLEFFPEIRQKLAIHCRSSVDLVCDLRESRFANRDLIRAPTLSIRKSASRDFLGGPFYLNLRASIVLFLLLDDPTIMKIADKGLGLSIHPSMKCGVLLPSKC